MRAFKLKVLSVTFEATSQFEKRGNFHPRTFPTSQELFARLKNISGLIPEHFAHFDHHNHTCSLHSFSFLGEVMYEEF